MQKISVVPVLEIWIGIHRSEPDPVLSFNNKLKGKGNVTEQNEPHILLIFFK